MELRYVWSATLTNGKCQTDSQENSCPLCHGLHNLEKLYKDYSAFMNDIIKKGYARKVPESWDNPDSQHVLNAVLEWDRSKNIQTVDLLLLAQFKMPRYIKPENFGQVVYWKLYHFSDALQLWSSVIHPDDQHSRENSLFVSDWQSSSDSDEIYYSTKTGTCSSNHQH